METFTKTYKCFKTWDPCRLIKESAEILGLNKAIHIINIFTHNIWYLQPNIPNIKGHIRSKASKIVIIIMISVGNWFRYHQCPSHDQTKPGWQFGSLIIKHMLLDEWKIKCPKPVQLACRISQIFNFADINNLDVSTNQDWIFYRGLVQFCPKT